MRSRENNIDIEFISAMEMSTLDDDDLVVTINVINHTNTKHTIPPEYTNYLDVFNENAATTLLEPRPSLDHKILLKPNTVPPYGPLYNLSETELKVLCGYIKTNLASGFIWRSKSPAGAPILFTKKKDNSLQLCVNYCGLNAITIRNWYPLPLILEMLDHLA